MVRVYHNRHFLRRPGAEFVPSNFNHVADVDVPDEDYSRAFELTNHIEDDWWENEEVTPRDREPKYRSTSVGDVIELSDGRKFRCQSIGWSEIL